MTPKQKTIAWLGGGVALMVVGTLVMFLLARNWTFAPPPPLVLSKETTWFTGPVLPNGGIDWVAAIEAEARAEGLKEEDDGTALLREAMVELEEASENVEKPDSFIESIDFEQRIEPAMNAVIRAVQEGKLDAQEIESLGEWLDAVAPVLEKARQAADRKERILVVRMGKSDASPNVEGRDEQTRLTELIRALRLRVATRAAGGDVDGALSDAAAACVLTRTIASPATFVEQWDALAREIALLEQLVRAVEGERALPADRVLAVVEARPPRWTGDAALAEALRGARLLATRDLDTRRFASVTIRLSRRAPPDPFPDSMAKVDLNPVFRRLQQSFDDLDAVLLGSSRAPRDRIDAFQDALQHRIDAGLAVVTRLKGPLGFLQKTDHRKVESYVDSVLYKHASITRLVFPDWLALTARRDALMAELAARAGAPERRDSWLGLPLVVTRKDDGSIEVGGALIDLSRSRGAELGEE